MDVLPTQSCDDVQNTMGIILMPIKEKGKERKKKVRFGTQQKMRIMRKQDLKTQT